MHLSRADLHHLTHATHGGRQILFAVDEARAIHYSIQRATPVVITTGYELSNAAVDALRRNKPDGLDVQDKLDSMIGEPFAEEAGLIAEFELRLGEAAVTRHKAVLVASARQQRSDHWFEWQILQLPREKEDPSVVAREREQGTAALVCSLYDTHKDSAFAGVQAVTDGKHLHVFRQSVRGTLLLDRFAVDGERGRLNRALEVRFKRSGQRFEPKRAADGEALDACDFRGANGEFFLAPTTELRLINGVEGGRFAVVVVPTLDHERARWHIFTWDSIRRRAVLTSLRSAEGGGVDLRDYTVVKGDAARPHYRRISAITRRILDLRGPGSVALAAAAPPSATVYDLQREVEVQGDEKELLRVARRALFAVPTDAGGKIATLSFAVDGDGDLAQLSEAREDLLLAEENERLLLPVDTLDRVRTRAGDRVEAAPAVTRRGLRFTGSNAEKATTSAAMDLAGKSFTVECWARRATTSDGWPMLVTQGKASAGEGLHLGFRNTDVFTFAFYADDLDTAQPYHDKDWHHWACVFDVDANRRRIYRDGVCVAEDQPRGAYRGSGPLRVGSAVWGSYFNGDLADVRIWRCARSEAEIKESLGARLSGRELDLIAAWPLDAIVDGGAHNLVRRAPTLEVDGVFASGRTLARHLADGTTAATSYECDDLVAVVERSTYIESFEFRGATAAPELLFWGTDRAGQRTAKVAVKAQIAELAGGWRRATARFTIPAGLRQLRAFDLRAPAGEWSAMELRDHRIERLRATVTETTTSDTVNLTELGGDHAARVVARARLGQLESDALGLRGRLATIEATLARSTSEQSSVVEALRREVAELDGKARAAAAERDLRERCLSYGQALALRGANGVNDRYLSVDGTNVRCNRDAASVWETLTIQSVTNPSGDEVVRYGDLVALRAHTGKYLIADNPNWPATYYYWLGAVYPEINAYERFQLLNPANTGDRGPVPRGGAVALLSYRSDHGHKFVITGTSGTWAQYLWCEGETPVRDANFLAVHRSESPAVARARQAHEEAVARHAARATDLATAERLAANLAADRARVQAERDTVKAELLRVEGTLGADAASLLTATRDDQRASLTMPALTPEGRSDTVTGALLGFARTSDRPQVSESLSGAVALRFADHDGRLRVCEHDVIDERWRSDDRGACVRFERSGSVEIPHHPSYGCSAFTIELWVRWDGQSDEYNFITGKGMEEYELHTGPGGALRFIPVTRLYVDTAPGALTPGRWTYVVCVYGGGPESAEIYVDGVLATHSRSVTAAAHAPSQAPLLLGCRQGGGMPLCGALQEVRLWSIALRGDEIRAQMHFGVSGHEPGLVGYWPLGDAEGDVTVDRSATGNHGKLKGPRFFPTNPGLGRLPQRSLRFGDGWGVRDLPGVDIANKSFTVEFWAKRDVVTGGLQGLVFHGSPGPSVCLHILYMNAQTLSFRFYADDLDVPAPADTRWHHWACVYDHAASRRTIYLDGAKVGEDRPLGPYRGGGAMRLGSYHDSLESRFAGQLADVRVWAAARSEAEVRANMHRRLHGGEAGLQTYWPLDGLEGAKVRDRRGQGVGAADGVREVNATDLPLMPAAALVGGEYDTLEAAGDAKLAVLRRALVWSPRGRIDAAMDQRVDVLEVRWIGNAQMKPTLLGYIEGPPPLPSENLTVADDYDGASSVELKVTESVTGTFDETLAAGADLKAKVEIGSAGNTGAGVSIGATAIEFADWKYVAQLGLEAGARFLQSHQTSGSVSRGTSEKISLRGAREPEAKFPALGRRYVPKNVGYATIISTLADVFALRLRGSKRLVSYRVTPVADVPPDVNTVTFMINPAYTLAGSLDGMIGGHPADARIYGHVPEARANYGSHLEASYFRPREAYALRDAIERRNRDLEAFSISLRADLMDSELAKASRGTHQAPGAGKDAQQSAAASATSSVAQQIEAQKAAQKRPDMPASIDELIARTPKGNIVNAYVWDGDGGLRSQTQVFATSWRLVLGGSFSVDIGGGIKANFEGFGAGFSADVMLSAHLSMSFTHTTDKTRAIELSVDLNCEGRDVTDNLDRPLYPGQKVDRFRFMSFALQANTAHFDDFFDKVVDPEWLRSDDEEAMLLRQIDRTKPNQAWRVLHRVTYVERPSRGAAPRNEGA